MINKILEIITEVKPGVDVFEDTKLFEDAGFDSFDLILLVAEFESAFEVDILGEDLVSENFQTPNQILQLIKRIKG